MQVRLSDHNSDILRNRTTNKVVGRIYVNATTGTDATAQVNDILHKTVVKVILRRGGKEIVLFQDKMALLALFYAMDKPIFPTVIDFAHKYSTTYPLNNDYTYSDGTATVFPLIMDLGCLVNLSGDDELLLDVVCNSQTIGTVSNCNINLEFEEAVGVGEYVSCTRFESIPGGLSTWVRDLGQNVTKIALLNLDVNTVSNSAAIVASLSINSDKVNLNDTWYDLLCRRFILGADSESIKKQFQNFTIYEGTELDKVKLNFTLNATAVNAGMNYVGHRFFITDENLIKRSQAMKLKHQGRDLLKFVHTSKSVAHAQSMAESGKTQELAAQSNIDAAK